MRLPAIVPGVILLIAVVQSDCFAYNDTITHPIITEAAALSKYSGLDAFLKNFLLFSNGRLQQLPYGNGVGIPSTATAWLRYGAWQEDAETICRASNHFHNPLNSKIWADSLMTDEPDSFRLYCNATSDYGFNNRTSAVTWATSYMSPAPNGIQMHSRNIEDWAAARQWYQLALTAEDSADREIAYAAMFRSLGQVLHLLQDMGVPAHVRNDFSGHLTQPVFGLPPFSEPYENYVKNKMSTLADFTNLLKDHPPIMPSFDDGTTLTKFWDTNVYDSTVKDDGKPRRAGTNLGLAEYTNANYVSEYSTFTEGLPTDDLHYFPHPTFSETNSNGWRFLPVLVRAEDGVTDSLRIVTITDPPEGVSDSSATRPIAAVRYSAADMGDHIEYYGEFTTKSDPVFEANAERLLPRAVGYSAALLDYFFRGRFDPIGDGRPFAEILPDGGIRLNFKNASGESLLDGTLTLYRDSGEENEPEKANLLHQVISVDNVILGDGEEYWRPDFQNLRIEPPAGKKIEDLIFTLVYVGRIGAEGLNSPPAVAARRFKANKAGLDLAVVFQPYFPYYNYTTNYLRRYRESLKDLLTSLQGGGVPADRIRLISSGCEGATHNQGSTIVGDCPELTVHGYGAAIAGLNTAESPWPTPASGHWYANLLDRALIEAKAFPGNLPLEAGKVRITRALAFTNWVHFDPQNMAPVSPSAKKWTAPFADAVATFGAKDKVPGIEFDAVDFYHGGILGYSKNVLNASKYEQRYPFDLDKNFNLPALADNSSRPPLQESEVGYVVLQDPYPNGTADSGSGGEIHLSGANKKRLFPWINPTVATVSLVSAGGVSTLEIPVDGTMGKLSLGVTADTAGTVVTLIRPDGSPVIPSQVGDSWVTDDPNIDYQPGNETYLIRSPQPGIWQVRLDRRTQSTAAQVRMHAYTDSSIRVDEVIPAQVRPGTNFQVAAQAGGALELRSPSLRLEFIRDTGSTYQIGERVVEVGMAAQGTVGSYAGNHAVSGYEGQLRYRLVLEGFDATGQLVHRESDGALLVQGDPPTIEALAPLGVTAAPLPLIQARVHDEVKFAKDRRTSFGCTDRGRYGTI